MAAISLPQRRKVAIALGALSCSATLAGMLSLLAFDETPGTDAGAPVRWPRLTRIPRTDKQAELLVFVHPFCSCTNATISELSKLMASTIRTPLAITFVVFRPGSNSGWKWHSLGRAASAISGARFVWDDEGLEAERFRATTSGLVLLYGSDGLLLFHGGVTGSRGHEGDNLGLEKLRSALKGGSTGSVQTVPSSRVFGCALKGADKT